MHRLSRRESSSGWGLFPVKHLIPIATRRTLHASRRWIEDFARGDRRHFARSTSNHPQPAAAFPPQITITQPITVSPLVANKVHNLTLAAQCINTVVINPQQVFSFWAVVGSPTRRRGYLPGQVLIRQILQADYGGGLCQLSGLLYQLALTAGLPILERHTHSVDIYTEATRYTPLGSDATVAYGYKDLRFANTLTHPVCVEITVASDSITGRLCTEAAIAPYQLEYLVKDLEHSIEVETLRWTQDRTQSQSLGKCRYRRPEKSPT